MKNNQKGFSLVEALLVIIALALIVGVGYYVFDSQRNASNNESVATKSDKQEAKETNELTADQFESAAEQRLYSIISFENETSFDSTDKQQILDRVAKPLVYYHSTVLDIELKDVTVRKSADQNTSPNYRYALSYVYASDPTKLGFLFGEDNKIGYWQPTLCDHGGCIEYPEAFKVEFPENHKAYVACQEASESGGKEKASEVCETI